MFIQLDMLGYELAGVPLCTLHLSSIYMRTSYTHDFVAVSLVVRRNWIHNLDSGGCQHLSTGFSVCNHLTCISITEEIGN